MRKANRPHTRESIAPSLPEAQSRRLWITLPIAAAAAIAMAGLSGCSGVPDVVKIGVAQPLTGPLAALGNDMVNGAKLAVKELNEQGFAVKGKKVTFEVVAIDDKANAEEGVKVAGQLVEAGVVAVIGHLNSGVSIAAAPTYAAKNIAQLAISTNPKYTELGFPTTLRLVANDTLQARAIGSFAAGNIEGAKYAVVDDGTPYGKGLAEAAAKQLQGKKTIAIRQSFNDKTTDFAELAQKIKADGVQVIVSTLNDFQAVALIDNLVKIQYTQVTLLGTDTLKTNDMTKHAGKISAMFATSPVLEASEFPAGREFLAKYQTNFKIAPAYGGHYTYDATHVIAAAIKRAGSASPAKITEALRKGEGYAPVTGSFKWNETGEQKYGVISIYTVRQGAWESQMRSDTW
jgi:branched-chain amino acid transport system substrate-binding protein